MQSYVKKMIYISEGNRCCRAHLIKGRFFDEELSRLRIYSNFAKVKDSELSWLLEGLTIECDTTILDKVGAFFLSEGKIHLFTGLTWKNIIDLHEMLRPVRNNLTRDVTQALVVFLLTFYGRCGGGRYIDHSRGTKYLMFLGKIWCFEYVKNCFKIPRNISNLKLTIFKVKGVCGNFLTIFFIFSARNYIEIPSQTFMTYETNFLHCTLRCLRGWSIYWPAVRSGTLPEISSDFMYKFCIL